MKLPANSRASWLAPLPALASAAALFTGPFARGGDELLAYWPMDETGGTAVPNSSSTSAATHYNGASWVAGTINNALSFNGVNQYVSAAVTVPLTNTAVSMWFRTSQAGGGLYATTEGGGGHDRHIYLNGGNIHSRIWNEETISSTGKNYADGQWHQVVHTFGGVAGGQKIYVDGVLVASGNKSASDFSTQTHVFLGYSHSSPTQFFNGQLDDVRIWNRALTAAEALALAQRSGTANYPNPPSIGIIGGAPLKLDWLAPTGATSHDIYLSGSPDIANSTPASEDFMGNFTTKPLDIAAPTAGSYYWRVDERLDTTVFKGPVWSFQYLDGIGSNSINFSQSTAWWVGANESFLQSGVLSGSGIFYKDGPGTLVLTGNNTHSGGTIIRDGVLQIGDGGTSGSLGSGPVTVNSTLTFKRSDEFTFSGILNGPGNVIQQGSGGLTLSGSGITHTGNTVLNGGSLTISGTPNFNSAIQINAGQLSFNTTSNYIVAPKVISGTGPVQFNGNNSNWTCFTAENTYSGGTLINSGGMLLLGRNTPAGSVLGNITDNGTLGLYHSTAWTFSNNVSGTGAINLYSPSGNLVTVSGNTLSLGNLNAFHNPGGILTNTTVNLSGSLNLYTDSTLTIGSGANVTVAGGMTQAGNAYNHTMSTLKVTGGNLTFGSQINDGWDGAYTVTQTGGTVRTPGITGGNGGGEWSTDTYNLEGGSLILGANGINGPCYKSPWFPNGGGLTMNLNFGGGTLSASANWTSGWGVNLTGTNGDLTVDPAGYSITINRPVTGIGGINLIGTGTLTLAGANTYSGSTTIATGTTFGGVGGMTGPVINNGTLTPGNSAPGILAVNNTLTLAPDSAIDWQLTNYAGTPGIGYDQITVNSLNLTATPEDPVTVKITAQSLTTIPAAEHAFVLIRSVSPITGFDAAKFNLDTTALPAGFGTWSIRQVDNNVELVYDNNSTVQGYLLVEKWLNSPDYSVADLVASSRIYGEPNQSELRNFSSLVTFPGEYFGTRTRGYIKPTVTGDYTFWISAMTSAELWLSTDDGLGKYAKKRIAALDPSLGTGHGIPAAGPNYWDNYACQKSVALHLEAGHSYYLEILHQHGHSGVSHSSVAWAMNGGSRVWIPAAVCSSYVKTDEDQDDDYLPDAWETQFGLNPNDNGAVDPFKQGERGDFDGDGLSNRSEYLLGTDPTDSDSDNDGECDSDEVNGLGTDPLVANVFSGSPVGSVNLANFISSSTGWTMTSGGLLADGFRGEATWNFNVPSDGNWLLRLNAELMGSTYGNEEVPIVIKVDGKTVIRRNVRFGTSKLGLLQAVTPWLTAGNHQVTVLVDNAFARRTVRLVSLNIYALADASAILAEGNKLIPRSATTRTSPAFVEGYARDPGSVTVNAIPAVNGIGRGHWFANVPLNDIPDSQTYSVHFEEGFDRSDSLVWQATNVMDAESLTIRQGDSIRVGAWGADPAMTSTITLSSGGSWNLTGGQTVVISFTSAGTFTVNGSLQGGASAVLTVKVIGAPNFQSGVVDVMGNRTRNLALTAAQEIAFDAPTDLCRLTVTRSGTSATVAVLADLPEEFSVAARLSTGGPILAIQRINVIGISDALENDLTSVASSSIVGYKMYTSPLTVLNLPTGGKVEVSIYRAGVMFTDGSTLKTIYPAGLTNGSVNLEFLFPLGMPGGYCHSVLVYDRNGVYLGTR